ncbi:hypothetical protein [Luteimonas granuli]|uniref:Uncharacterized protein n=1 Tax=Luteimonas granuli TaxID=1176533 RepID=A0A518N3E5_9GAMM|nr:hypothetical protein [Luteimonas granuli]QDW66397.1 hypothetical protein FPZ22_05375 [Luteimonas granuli]
MDTDWKQAITRVARAAGALLWLVGRHLYALLLATGRFIVQRAIPAGWHWLRGTAWPGLRRFYLWLPHRRKVVAGAAATATIVLAVLLLRSTPEPSTQPSGPATLAFAPVEAAPAAPVFLSGVEIAPGMEFEVRIGGEVVASQRLADGRVQTHVPVTFGQDGWPIAPRGEQAIELRSGDALLARSKGGIRVLELQRAPGTTAKVQQSLDTIVAGYELIFETLPAQDDREMAHRRAVMAMLKGLVSEGDRSLAAVLAGNSPWLEGAAADLELTDALLASSGVAGHYAARAAVFRGPGQVAAGAALPMSLGLPPLPTGPRCRQGGKAFELACQMQAHGLITDLSQAYIKPTADTYADSIGIALGALGLDPVTSELMDKYANKAMVVHQITSALLSVVNFTMEKIAPSLLPSVLGRFELEVHPTLIRKGDMTKSRLMVEARNQPQTITANDLVDLVKSVLGLPKLSARFEGQITKVGFFVIDLYMMALRQWGVEPPRGMNPDVFTMPARTWGPLEVDSADLVTLFSYDPGVLAPREEDLEWLGTATGVAKVRMMPRGGGRGKVLVDNTLCWGCVWSGGAFGTEMPEASEEVAVDIAFKALQPRGRAPHRTSLQWTLPRREDGSPVPCTIDFGDGSQPERIPDCTDTDQVRHEFQHTSRLEEGGAWKPTLRIDGSDMKSETEVFTDWSFFGSPDSGQAPVDARFSWNVPWPPDRKAPACEFDPGDGSKRQRFDDCLATTHTTQTFERRGSFAPQLTLIHDGRRDWLTAPVSVAAEGSCDEDLLKAKAWTGTVSYTHSRDVWNARSDHHVKYNHRVSLDAEMEERTRREFRGDDYLVQYYSPLPRGTASIDFTYHSYTGGTLSSYDTFNGQGALKRQEPDMSEEGSMLTLILDARRCIYQFHLQAEVHGSGQRWNSLGDKTEDYSGYRWINTVWYEGEITSSASISGSAAIPVRSKDDIHDPQVDTPIWVAELDFVSGALGGNGLGTTTVNWSFRPAD